MPILGFPGVGKDPFILRAEQRKPAVPEYAHRLAQGNQPAVIVENGIRVRQSRPGVDFPVVFASAKEGYSSLDPNVREGDMRPLLDRWYPLYLPSKKLGGKMCLGYDVEDEYIENLDGKMKFGTHLFVIKEDGTIGTVGEDNYYVVESVKKI